MSRPRPTAPRYRRRIFLVGMSAALVLFCIGFPIYNNRIEADLERRVPAELADAFVALVELVDVLENNRTYRNLSPYGEPQLGWGSRVAAPLEVIDVPGGHASLLQEPNVQKLADAMNQHLVRAQDSRSETSAPAPFVERRARPRTTLPQPARQTAEIDG